jgi:pimeloyl-ACP methyl ester carboxylesterase
MNYVLVHGSYHGPWCWDGVRSELERRGHTAVAVDMPISTPGVVTAGYAQAVIAAIEDVDAPIIVGHSMGGLVIPVVAQARPVRKLVFLAAFLPQPGKSIADQREAEPIDGPFVPATAEWTDMGSNVWMVGPNTATEIFYSDLTPDLAREAVKQLRPQCYDFMAEASPLVDWPKVESDVVVCRDDHAINPDWVRSAARERLGVEAHELPGGHSPFLGRPIELVDLLEALA